MNGIDKAALYGRFQAGEDWQQKLKRKATYKALDIADDDVQISAPKIVNHYGTGPLGLAAAALFGALPAAALAGFLWWQGQQQPPPAPMRTTLAPAVVSPTAGVVPEWDAVYEERQPDGSWKVLRRERVPRGESPAR